MALSFQRRTIILCSITIKSFLGHQGLENIELVTFWDNPGLVYAAFLQLAKDD